MKTPIRWIAFSGLAFAGLLLASLGKAAAQESPERLTVPFSDTSRPGEVAVRLVNGSITVKAADVREVTVERVERRDAGGRSPRESPDAGTLRRLPQNAALVAEERNNRVEISTRQMNRVIHLEIQVPRRTNLTLSTVNSGNVEVEGVEGEHEIGNVNGSIGLKDVSGSVVAHTVNGRVIANLVRVTPGKPMAFTSLNGAVDVTLPETTKANLKLRTDNGSIFSDFELTGLPQPAVAVEDTGGSNGRYRIEKNQMIYASINGGGPDIELRTFNGGVFVRKGR